MTRLDRTKVDKLLPKVAYSPEAFNPSQRLEWLSPWGQAFAFLKRIAEFPRDAMTNRFFWQGIRTDEDALIKAMNVAGDHPLSRSTATVKPSNAPNWNWTYLVKQLEEAPGDAQAKYRALWRLITTGTEDAVVALVDEAASK